MGWEEKRLSIEIGKGAAAIAGALTSRHGLDSASSRETADFLSQKLAELSGLGMKPPPVRQPIVIDVQINRQPAPVLPVLVKPLPIQSVAVQPAPDPVQEVQSKPVAGRSPTAPVSSAKAASSASAVQVPAQPRTVKAAVPSPAPRKSVEAPARRPSKAKILPSKGRKTLARPKTAVQAETAVRRTAARIGKTVFLRRIVSLEDGQSYQDLRPHLRALGLTPDQYRRKHGLPDHYPMVPPAVFLKTAEYIVVATY